MLANQAGRTFDVGDQLAQHLRAALQWADLLGAACNFKGRTYRLPPFADHGQERLPVRAVVRL